MIVTKYGINTKIRWTATLYAAYSQMSGRTAYVAHHQILYQNAQNAFLQKTCENSNCVHYPVPDLKNFVKIFAPSQNMVDLCIKMTHAKYFFCNAKIATVQALQSF